MPQTIYMSLGSNVTIETLSELVKYLKNVYLDLLVLAEDPPVSDVI